MLSSEALSSALAKVAASQGSEASATYTPEEIAALSAWMMMDLASNQKLTREEKRDRNRAAWSQGDRSRWGGERRRRDKRRGWRNFS